MQNKIVTFATLTLALAACDNEYDVNLTENSWIYGETRVVELEGSAQYAELAAVLHALNLALADMSPISDDVMRTELHLVPCYYLLDTNERVFGLFHTEGLIEVRTCEDPNWKPVLVHEFTHRLLFLSKRDEGNADHGAEFRMAYIELMKRTATHLGYPVGDALFGRAP